MKRILALFLCAFIASPALADQPGIVNATGTTLYPSATPGTISSQLATDRAGRILPQSPVDPSGNQQSIIPISNSSALNGPGSGVIAGVYIGTATATGGTTTVPTFASHSYRVGDWAKPISGTAANIGAWSPVIAITATTITLANALPSAPANADILQVIRPMPVVGTTSSGNNLTALGVSMDTATQFSATTGLLKQEDTAVSNNEATVGVGAKAQSALSSDTTADRWGLIKTDMAGRVMVGGAPSGSMVVGCNTAVTTATTGSMIAAVASNFTFITSWNCTNTGGTASRVILEDGDGTDLANLFLAATTGSDSVTFPTPVRTNVVNKAIQINVITSGSSTICCASGYTGVI